jgi:hypothetical protein
MKWKSINDRSISEGQENSKGPNTSLNKASSQKTCVYEIGPPSWLRKRILNTNNRYFVSMLVFLLICQNLRITESVEITSVFSKNCL